MIPTPKAIYDFSVLVSTKKTGPGKPQIYTETVQYFNHTLCSHIAWEIKKKRQAIGVTISIQDVKSIDFLSFNVPL